MGDRGNVYITSTEGYSAVPEGYASGTRGLYLYSHWDGSNLPTMLRDALIAGKGRWSDDSYLTRIIIDQITKSGRDQETGYGISPVITDNEYPITIVDLGAQRVSWASPGDERDPAKWGPKIAFVDYIGRRGDPDSGELSYPPGVRGRWG